MSDSFDQAIIPLGSDRVLRDKYLTHLGGVRIGRLLEDMDVFAVHLVIHMKAADWFYQTCNCHSVSPTKLYPTLPMDTAWIWARLLLCALDAVLQKSGINRVTLKLILESWSPDLNCWWNRSQVSQLVYRHFEHNWPFVIQSKWTKYWMCRLLSNVFGFRMLGFFVVHPKWIDT